MIIIRQNYLNKNTYNKLTLNMALIYLGYKAYQKKMGGGEEPELTEEEKMEKLSQPVEESKAGSKYSPV